MIIVGELINASRKAIGAAIQARDAAAIQKVAQAQAEAGADYIDVNAGNFVGKEPEHLKWLVETVQRVTDKPCAIDSPDPAAIEAALQVHRGPALILNQTFMVMAIANPLDQQMMANIIAAEALAGKDNFGMKHLKAYRAGAFER